MWQDFGEYIISEIGSEKVKVAEIGIGKFKKISEMLSQKENITLIKVDINPDDDSIVRDDITDPDFDLYDDVDIIYSIRPPSELQPYLVKLAGKINSQLIIKPLTGEDLNTPGANMKLKNFKKASFYVLR